MNRLVTRVLSAVAALSALTCAIQPAHAGTLPASAPQRAGAVASGPLRTTEEQPGVESEATAPAAEGSPVAPRADARGVDVRWSGNRDAHAQAARRKSAGEPLRPAAIGEPVVLADPCPVGTVRSATLLAEGFEGGTVPEAKDTKGWTVMQDAGAAQGSRMATSVIDEPAAPPHTLFLPVVMNPAGRTVLRFLVRGDYPPETVFVHVNGVNGWLEPGNGWGTVTLDVTPVASPSAEFDVRIGHYAPGSDSPRTRVDIDAVEVYRCGPVPATGVRGDVTGDRRSDVLAKDRTGTLWVLPGMRNGSLGARSRGGGNWSATSWWGSPGDVTGDRRPDLLARRTDGSLWRYPGRSDGSFGTPVRVGRGWAGMNALVLPGDISGDGRPDLVARDQAGTLWRYTIGAGGILSGKVAIGRRFGSLRHLSSTGDLTGDGVGDILAVQADGRMVRYEAKRTGLALTALMGRGWQGFAQLTGPGDLDGDGLGDLLARATDGRLSVYLSHRASLNRRRPPSPPWQDLVLVG